MRDIYYSFCAILVIRHDYNKYVHSSAHPYELPSAD